MVVRSLPTDGARFESDHGVVHLYDEGALRHLAFELADGGRALQTVLDLAQPERLWGAYPPAMFATYVLRPEQADVLFVGLGGGAMVRYLRIHEPETRITAVELDPVVVRVAVDYFGVRADARTTLVTADAYDFLASTERRFDAIYMDAYLAPASGTDPTGVPRRLKAVEFLRSLVPRLKPGGVVSFNLKTHPGLDDDLAAVREAFPTAYVLDLERSGNVVAIGSTASERVADAELTARMAALKGRFGGTLDLPTLVARVR